CRVPRAVRVLRSAGASPPEPRTIYEARCRVRRARRSAQDLVGRRKSEAGRPQNSAATGQAMKKLLAIGLSLFACVEAQQAPGGPRPVTRSVPDDPPASGADNPMHEQPATTTPFSPEVYRARRAHLMSAMKGGVAVVLSAQRVDWEADARQDSDFFYLTGLADESGAALLLAPQDEKKETLFLGSPNPEVDRWTGYRTTLPSRELEQRTGIPHLRPIGAL